MAPVNGDWVHERQWQWRISVRPSHPDDAAAAAYFVRGSYERQHSST